MDETEVLQEVPAGVHVRVEHLGRSVTRVVREAVARQVRPALLV